MAIFSVTFVALVNISGSFIDSLQKKKDFSIGLFILQFNMAGHNTFSEFCAHRLSNEANISSLSLGKKSQLELKTLPYKVHFVFLK